MVIEDVELKKILSTVFISTSSDSRESSISSTETLPIAYEDMEYEECFMDDDLEEQIGYTHYELKKYSTDEMNLMAENNSNLDGSSG